ncbi:MAG: hypothetical protein A3G60_00270 [Candidatus Ryanbacteria bacterium RIFCSPLOWO2_12_FULL_47_9c]|uniref:Dipeptidylpeptidase IV N-terminal domain-containing protein n=1 Tax=Candidatus Ryanbacteria bacterium RIFCSPLOWO2_12_FULL_47_9c TaxID=1802131 RepID=A0A1G2H1R2_9BACT|nr:MAG: hypothetical protein UY14_C0006G0013 [Parcubacteria group bacterium GW2011_GWA1_47_9]OGZ56407.1 MAG: hypothetical protein A3G60_00270 [Candidatus Ryanbacteria bacterium RIFCSPLOWO2_12_FULL_47_9c]
MSEENKIRFLLLSGLILVIIVGIFVFYALRGGNGETNDKGVLGIFLPYTGGGGPPTSGGDGSIQGPGSGDGGEGIFKEDQELKPEARERLVQLSQEPVIGPYVRDKDGVVLYFKRGVGHVFQVPFDGREEENRSVQFTIPNIIDVDWNQNGEYALLTTLNDSVVKNFWLHFTSTSTIETGAYPDIFIDKAFSPDGTKLASYVKQGGAYVIRTSTQKGTGIKTVYSTNIPDYEIAWISPSTISLKTKTSAFAPSLFQIIRATGGTPTTIDSGKQGFDVLWDPQGLRYLSTRTNRLGALTSIALYDPQKPKTSVPLPEKTLPEKCVFSKKDADILYCAFPRNIRSEPLPDAWWKGEVTFTDVLAKFNAKTGDLTPVLGGTFDITNLTLSAEEDYIFFINKKDSTLWSFRLTDQETKAE